MTRHTPASPARHIDAIVASWRRLTGASDVPDSMRRTLVACSGGADSTALILALASRGVPVVMAHVVHDMRARDVALADADRVRQLAAQLGVEFSMTEVVRDSGNIEASLRRARYRALAQMAASHACAFVATGHHANDQAETVIMRLIRGSGAAAIGGMRARRVLERDIDLIRPMLMVRGEVTREICRSMHVEWNDDATNTDVSQTRAFLRHSIIPGLERLAPGAVSKICSSSALVGHAGDVVRRSAEIALAASRVESEPRTIELDRRLLASSPNVVVGEAVRIAASSLSGGRGIDRMGERSIGRVVRQIRAGGVGSGRRDFALGPVRATVDDSRVTLSLIATS